MNNKSYGQFHIMQAKIDANSKSSDKRTNTYWSQLDKLMAMIKNMMDQIKISDSSPDKLYSPNYQNTTNMVPEKNKYSPLEGGNYTQIDGMLTHKHESSSKIYETLVKAKLKGDTALGLNNFYNNIKMSLNAVTRLQEDLLPDYQSIKSHSEF